MVLFNELGRLWRELNASRGYQEVRTPILFDTELWKRSGHWDNYRDNMFLTEQVEGRQFGLKPMNCPGHVEIYNHAPALLPRPAAAARRAGARAPQRGLGLDARPPARAPHHAGRRAHLLPLGPGRGGGRRLPRARERDLRDVRAATSAPSSRRGRTSASAARRSGTAWRPRCAPALATRRLGLRREPRRRRLLRAQDRPPHDRLDRPQLADGHDPARRLDAASASTRPTRRARTSSSARS